MMANNYDKKLYSTYYTLLIICSKQFDLKSYMM